MKYVVFALLVVALSYFIVRSIVSIVKNVKRIKENKKNKEVKDNAHTN